MINPRTLRKKELLLFLTGRCKHYHKYFEHPACFEAEQKRPAKIGYFDIETGGLKANTDIMLCYSIKTRNSDEILHGKISKEDINNWTFDKKLIEKLIVDLLKYDVIVTYYGTGFDIPFIRTRALGWKLKFPIFKVIQHKDAYYMVRNKLKLTSSSLATACEMLQIDGKNHIKWRVWIKAKHGHEESLQYVQDHCDRDVKILERLHKRLEIFVAPTVKSI